MLEKAFLLLAAALVEIEDFFVGVHEEVELVACLLALSRANQDVVCCLTLSKARSTILLRFSLMSLGLTSFTIC